MYLPRFFCRVFLPHPPSLHVHVEISRLVFASAPRPSRSPPWPPQRRPRSAATSAWTASVEETTATTMTTHRSNIQRQTMIHSLMLQVSKRICSAAARGIILEATCSSDADQQDLVYERYQLVPTMTFVYSVQSTLHARTIYFHRIPFLPRQTNPMRGVLTWPLNTTTTEENSGTRASMRHQCDTCCSFWLAPSRLLSPTLPTSLHPTLSPANTITSTPFCRREVCSVPFFPSFPSSLDLP